MKTADISELQSFFSDFHKDFYGFRPRPSSELWNDPVWLQKQIDYIDSAIERMKETFEGREELREQGWIVVEADPELARQAAWLESERKRFMNEEWERIHADDRPVEPDWDMIALEYEQYEDKITEKGA